MIAALRRVRMTGPEIAEILGMATSTVSAVLKRIGLGRLSRLAPPEPAHRYERSRPGELLHIDVKKLGRISAKGAGHRVTGDRSSRVRRGPGHGRGATGWERVHVCVDDATRLAYAEVLPDEKATTAIGFLRRAPAFYRSHGVEVERVMTDNGSAYISGPTPPPAEGSGSGTCEPGHAVPRPTARRSASSARCCASGPTRPSTGSSPERAAALSGWLERYNHRRRHGALGHRPPIERLREMTGNNVAGIYT